MLLEENHCQRDWIDMFKFINIQATYEIQYTNLNFKMNIKLYTHATITSIFKYHGDVFILKCIFIKYGFVFQTC